MSIATLLLCASIQVAAGRALLDRLHTYDIERYDVRATQTPAGLEVKCTLTLEVLSPGPLRFLISPEIDLRGIDGGEDRPLTVELGAGLLDPVLKAAARGQPGVPTLLTVGPSFRAGEKIRFSLAYLWRPAGDGLSYAATQGVQTHLSGFWLPTMADERFDAVIEYEGDGRVVASGLRVDVGGGMVRFETREPAQVLCLVAGDFEVHRRSMEGRLLEVWLPPSIEEDPELLLDDLARVLETLEGWFGPAVGPQFRLLVEQQPRPSPSYCAGSFAVVHRATLPGARGRLRWLELLAHECSHIWWGHRVATPVVGGGGTFLREGLAQWTGAKVAGTLLDERAERALFRAYFKAYVSRLDLRREKEALLANEVTLMDATYLDPASVSYLRGALVHRCIEHRIGAKRFRAKLRDLAEAESTRFLTGAEFAKRLGVEDVVAYLAGTTRLPDFVLREVEVAGNGVSAEVACLDALWPGGAVPCAVTLASGEVRWLDVAFDKGVGRLEWRDEERPVRIEIDPERVWLDPIRSNGIWQAP